MKGRFTLLAHRGEGAQHSDVEDAVKCLINHSGLGYEGK